MGELVYGFEERRQREIDDETNHDIADRALLLVQLEYWAEKETDTYRAYEYAKDKRENISKRLGMFVMPGRPTLGVPEDSLDF